MLLVVREPGWALRPAGPFDRLVGAAAVFLTSSAGTFACSSRSGGIAGQVSTLLRRPRRRLGPASTRRASLADFALSAGVQHGPSGSGGDRHRHREGPLPGRADQRLAAGGAVRGDVGGAGRPGQEPGGDLAAAAPGRQEGAGRWCRRWGAGSAARRRRERTSRCRAARSARRCRAPPVRSCRRRARRAAAPPGPARSSAGRSTGRPEERSVAGTSSPPPVRAGRAGRPPRGFGWTRLSFPGQVLGARCRRGGPWWPAPAASGAWTDGRQETVTSS